MDKLVHYTSYDNWMEIKRAGALSPLTDPNEHWEEVSERVRNTIQANLSYLVGIPEPMHTGWVEYGLMDYLLKYTTNEVILCVPILKPEKCFVRDHTPFSPKRLVDQYGEDLATAFHKGNLSFYEPRIAKAFHEYLESTISLQDYDGSYCVPEIWLGQRTPLDKITVL